MGKDAEGRSRVLICHQPMICLEVLRKITKTLTVDRFLAKMCTRDLQNTKWQKYLLVVLR